MFKTLKEKISLIYVGLVLLTAMIGVISVLCLAHIETSVNGMMTNNYASIQASQHMISALEQQNTTMLTYIYKDDNQSINAFVTSNKTFLQYYNMETLHMTEKGEKETAEKIDANYADFQIIFAELQKLRDTKDENTAFEYYHSTVLPAFTQLNADLNKIIYLNQTSMLKSKAQTSANTKTSLMILLLTSVFAVLTGFFVSRHFVLKFLQPLQQMSQMVSKLKGGRLDLQLDIKTNDEIGELASEFNEMTIRLRSYEQSTKGQLLSERNKSMAIVKSISDPLIVLDDKFKIILINDACGKLFDISEEKAQGRHFLESICNGELFNNIMDCVASESERTQKIIKIENGGTELYFNIAITKTKNSSETGYIFLMHNVTEFKKLEQVKTDFIATISHEFKTPLTAVVMGTSLLEDKGLGGLNTQQADVLSTVIENAQRLSDFVSELLALSKMESGKSIYAMEACSINEVVYHSCNQFVESAKKSGIRLTNQLKENLPTVYADFEKITWVLNNLISNALKYTKSGDQITVNAQVQGEYMVATVTDTGDGIPLVFIDRVFDKYVQVKTHDIEARGTGLGLSVAKEIVTAHHGQIDVESKLEQGSKFTFTLPLYREELQ